jgi:hypothetical protein
MPSDTPTPPAKPTPPHSPDSNHIQAVQELEQGLEEAARVTSEVATLAVTRAAPLWPALLGFAAIVAIYLVLPERYMAGPRWLLPMVVIVLLAAIYIARYFERPGVAHHVGIALGVAITLAVAASAAFLVTRLQGQRTTAPDLLRDAALIWIANVLCFALWYWRIDCGGPLVRHRDVREAREHADFLWPQWTLDTPAARAWIPQFIDYVFLAFNTSTAFSPTDTLVLSRRAKLLMMAQSLISLIVIGFLVARAINTL